MARTGEFRAMIARGLLSALALVAACACALARPDNTYPTKPISGRKDYQAGSLRKPPSAESNALASTPLPTALSKVPEAVIVDPTVTNVNSHKNHPNREFNPNGNSIIYIESGTTWPLQYQYQEQALEYTQNAQLPQHRDLPNPNAQFPQHRDLPNPNAQVPHREVSHLNSQVASQRDAPKPNVQVPLYRDVTKPIAQKPLYSDVTKLNAQVPLHRDVSKPVNQRYPHAVLFGGTCGGSIISPKWILTAGHCTLFTGGRYILAGTNNSEDSSGVPRRVKKLYLHPLFSVGPYWLNAHKYDIKQVAARWDFLLAELEEPLELDGTTMAAVPLNDEPDVAPETYVGYAGYGTDHHGGSMRSEMHGMDLKTRADKTCEDKLEQFNKEDMLCARGYEPEYNSACNGDSGSGLVGNGKLVGIASWVENDAFECKAGNTVVFSKVAAARDWIRRVAKV